MNLLDSAYYIIYPVQSITAQQNIKEKFFTYSLQGVITYAKIIHIKQLQQYLSYSSVLCL